jgi:hypothetical protein
MRAVLLIEEGEAEMLVVIVWEDIRTRRAIQKKAALIVAVIHMTMICPMQEAVKVAAEVKVAEAVKAVAEVVLPMRVDIPETTLKIG